VSSLIAVVVVAGSGLPMAYAVTRRPALALLLGPLATGLLASVAMFLMLLIGGNLLFWGAALVVSQGVLIWKLRGRAGSPLPQGSWVTVVAFTAPLLLPFMIARFQPIEWDAHSIWWLHAAYFSHDAGYARAALGAPAFWFSHPDYPPFTSAPIAAVWELLGDYDFRVAQVVSALTTFSAIGLLVYAVRRVTAAAPAPVSWFVAVGVGYVTWDPAPYSVTNGLNDALWAAAFGAAATLLLFDRRPLVDQALPVVLMAVAVLSKNEGFVMAVVLAAIVTVRERRDLVRTVLVWIPVAVGAVWIALARFFGAQSDLAGGARFDALVHGDVGTRLQTIVDAMWVEIGVVAAFAAAAAVVGGTFLRQRRRDFGLPSDGWLWAVNASYFAVLILTYMITPYGLDWHLVTSVERVTILNLLLAGVSAAGWAAVAIGPRGAGADLPGASAFDRRDTVRTVGRRPAVRTLLADVGFGAVHRGRAAGVVAGPLARPDRVQGS
jgi:hypothetical protein